MESQFFGGVGKFLFRKKSSRKDDDICDRFTHVITSVLLIFFIIIISARQYIGQPISCWLPAEFSRSQEQFSESTCWVSNTYTVKRHVYGLPESIEQREAAMIRYYQWMPFLLMIQVILCCFPCLVWRFLHSQSNARLASIMEVVCDLEVIDTSSSRENTIAYIARHIEDAVMSEQFKRNDFKVSAIRRRLRYLLKIFCCFKCTSSGFYLLLTYLVCKVLYVANALLQMYLMKYFYGTPHLFYGWDLLLSLFQGARWEESGYFPRVTICDFEVKKLGNTHRYSVQCALPMNMLNEKIFIFLWFWMVLVLLVSFLSLLSWTATACCTSQQFAFVKRFLQLRGCLPLYKTGVLMADGNPSSGVLKSTYTNAQYPSNSDLKKQLRSFVSVYLQHDGVFILRLIAHNAGELFAAVITAELWNNHCNRMNLHCFFPPGGYENYLCTVNNPKSPLKVPKRGEKPEENDFRRTPSTMCKSPRIPATLSELDSADVSNIRLPPVMNNHRISGRASMLKRDDMDDVV